MRDYEIDYINWPKYREFATKAIYSKLKDVPNVVKNIPDLQESELSEVKYWHQVILTLYPKEMFQMIKKTQQNRGIKKANAENEFIKLTSQFEYEINSIISMPSKSKGVWYFSKTSYCSLLADDQDSTEKEEKVNKEASLQVWDHW